MSDRETLFDALRQYVMVHGGPERHDFLIAISGWEKSFEKFISIWRESLDVIKNNGFVFDDLGREPGNWQHLAFTLYTNLCEVESIAKAALEAE